MIITDGKLYAAIYMGTFDGSEFSPDMSSDFLKGSYLKIGKFDSEPLYKVDNLKEVEYYLENWKNYATDYNIDEEIGRDINMGIERCISFIYLKGGKRNMWIKINAKVLDQLIADWQDELKLYNDLQTLSKQKYLKEYYQGCIATKQHDIDILIVLRTKMNICDGD